MTMRMKCGLRAASLATGVLALLMMTGPSFADPVVGVTTDQENGATARPGKRPPVVQRTPPAIRVEPSFLTFSVFSGGRATESLTVENLGGSTLTFTANAMQSFPIRLVPLPRRTCSSSAAPAGPANSRSVAEAAGPRGCWAYGGGAPLILVYTDDVLRGPGTTHIDGALHALGLAYTAYYSDPNGFGAALVSQQWDLVVVDHNNYYGIGTLWESLRGYLESGGKLLVTTFDVDGSDGNPTLLWADFGAAPTGDIAGTTLPVYRWVQNHPIFTIPQSVPDFTQMHYDDYLDTGDLLSVTPPPYPVAGFTPFPAMNQAAIVVSSQYNAVLNSFLVSENPSDLDSDGTPDAQELYENEIVFLLNNSPWISVDPSQGEVPPNGSVDLAVTIDASGIPSGTRNAEIRIASNDPDVPETIVPVTLEVDPAPDVDLEDASIDFGPVFVGGSPHRTLTVTNRGELPLTVEPMSLPDPAFEVDLSGFVLEPGQHRDLEITFRPDHTGAFTTALEIPSDDPDEPSVTIPLTGSGVPSPHIGATPSGFHEVLLAGQSVSRTLTIDNSGGAPLVFEVSSVDSDAPLALSGPGLGPQDGGSTAVVATGRKVPLDALGPRRIGGPRTVTARVASAADNTGAEPAPSSGSGLRLVGTSEEVFGNQDTLLEGELRSRGNIFRCTRSSRLHEHRFWLAPPSNTELWFLVYEGTSASGIYTLISASDTTPAGPGGGWYSSGDVDVPLLEDHYYLIVASFDNYSTYYNQQSISPYPIPASFGELIAGAGWGWGPATGFPPLTQQDVPPEAFGDSVAYYQTLVVGPGSVEWISIVPDSGELPPEGSLDLTVTFDTAGLLAGHYAGQILIASNDPRTPVLEVPAELTVIGAPNIVLDASRLDFGTLFVGQRRALTLTVSNDGTDELHVSTIVSGKKDFETSRASLVVPPRESTTVTLAFSPTKVGSQETSLTIVSDDPDAPTLFVTLLGTGVKPPVVSVSPAALDVTVAEGGEQTRSLTVKNLGTSHLDFTARVLPHGPGSGSCNPARVFVNEYSSGELSVVELSTGIVTRLALGLAGPHLGLELTGDGTTAYVTEASSGRITHVDLTTGAKATVVQGLAFPAGLVLKDQGRSAWLVEESRNDLLDVDLVLGTTRTVATGFDVPSGLAVDAAGTTGYVTEYASGLFTEVDLATGAKSTIVSGLNGPVGIALDGAGFAYLLEADGGSLTKVNLSTHTMTRIIAGLLHYPFGIRLESSGSTALITQYNTNSLSRISLDTGAITPIASGLSGATGLTPDVPAGCTGGFLSLTPTSGSLNPGQTTALAARFDSVGLLGGTYFADIELESSDPITPRLLIPASLTVVGTPDIDVGGETVNVVSSQDYTFSGASTQHSFPIAITPVGGGTMGLVADGDYGSSFETATLSTEGILLGSTGGTGSDCLQATATFTLTSAQLEALAADGHIDVTVQNSSDVDTFCTVNRHTVTLRYQGPADFSFGDVYYGASRSLTIAIHNTGSQELVVSSIASDQGEFVPSVSSLIVAPHSTQPLTVVFTPSAVSPFSGTLTIASNDPDEPVLSLPLTGAGVEPPEIEVTPASFSESLFSGESVNRTLTIHNAGGNPLTWDLSIDLAPVAGEGTNAARGARRSIAPAPLPGPDPALSTGSWSTSSSTAGVSRAPSMGADGKIGDPGVIRSTAGGPGPMPGAALGGGDVLIVEDALPWGYQSNQIVLNALEISFDVIGSASLPSTDLGNYRVVLVASDQPMFTYQTLAQNASQIDDYVSQGGILEFHAAGWGANGGDASLVTLPGGVGIVFFTDSTDTVLLPEHPLVAGVANPINGSSASHSHLTGLPADADIVAVDDTGGATLAVYRHGLGWVVTGGLTFEYGYANQQDAGKVLSNLIPYTASFSPPWLTLSPTSGTVPAAGTVDVTTTFTSGILIGGDYDAIIHVSSNDPDEAVVDVPAHLHITGAPAIVLSETDLDFGEVFIGGSLGRTVRVSNRGTDTLHVTGVSSGDPAFTADSAGFVLTPGAHLDLTVTFAPQLAAPVTTSLVLTSDDPDNPQVAVSLEGTGLVPPVAGVDPSSFSVTLLEGATDTRTLTLSNTGGSALAYRIFVHGADPCAPSAFYVTGQSHAIQAVDPATGATHFIAPGINPYAVAFEPRAQMIYATVFDRLYAVDPATGGIRIAASGMGNLLGLVISRDGSTGYAVDEYLRGIQRIDLATGARQALYNGLDSPFGIALSPDERTAYVVQSTGQLSAVDLANNAVRVVASNLNNPHGVAIDHNARTAYVTEGGNQTVTAIDVQTGRRQTLAGGLSDPFGIVLSDDGTQAYVALNDSGQLARIDLASGQVSFISSTLSSPFFPAFQFPPGCSGEFLTVDPLSGSVPAGSSEPVTVDFATLQLLGGTYSGDLEIRTNDPLRPRIDVPATLTVIGIPNIDVGGEAILLSSSQDYSTSGASTSHSLQAFVTPIGGGIVRLVADGDYGDSFEIATLSAEGNSIGSAGPTGSDCTVAAGEFPVSAALLAALVADGHVDISVQNSPNVDSFCTVNRHTVTLQYQGPADFSFGDVYYGASRSLTVAIHNTGSQELVVSSIASDQGEFVPSASSLIVAPRSTQPLTVVFTPSALGPFSGTLTIASNDPDEPVLSLPLTGAGVEPPEIEVTPASFSENLFSGESVDRTLTIHNAGGAVLTWDLSIDLAPVAGQGANAAHGARRSIAPAPLPGPDPGLPAGSWSTSSSTAGVSRAPSMGADGKTGDPGVVGSTAGVIGPAPTAALGGADVLIVEDALPWGVLSNQTVLNGNGITFDVIGTASLPSTDLGNYRVVLVASDQTTFTYQALAQNASQIDDYVSQGGILEFHAAGWGYNSGNASLVTLPGGVGIVYYSDYTNVVLLPEHPLVAAVPNPINGTSASHSHLTGLPADADIVAVDDTGGATLAVYRHGLGWVVTGGLTFEYGYANQQDPGKVLSNLIPYTASFSPPWLTLSPTSGTVPAAGTVDVTTTFTSGTLLGGDYDAIIHVSSNDPDEAVVDVPAHLHITGAPAIVLSETDLDFGELFIGGSLGRTVRVSNLGTDTLHVTDVSSGDPAFTADSAGFVLAPGGHLDLTVTFSPLLAGPVATSLVLTSDDPDDPQAAVSLEGTGLEPPDIQMTPPSLSVSVHAGEATDRILTVANTGLGELLWSLLVSGDGVAGSGASSPGLGVAWLSVTPLSGTVPAGLSTDVTVTFAAYSLPPGDYDALITVSSNDPDEPAVNVPVHLHVIGVPRISVSPLQLAYGTVYVGQSSSLSITVTSIGTDSLSVTGLTFGDPAFTADASSFVLVPGDSRIVNVTFAPQNVGPINTTLSVASDDPVTPITSIALQGAGAIPPDLDLSPASFDESVTAGQSITRTLTIGNPGGTTLDWRVATSTLGLQGLAIESDSLEEVLASLDSRFASVTAAIPNRFDFNEGESGYSILDGGNDMYDDGNYLLTDTAQGIVPYSDGVIATDTSFGGRYFTRKYPGLFVFVADLQGPDAFFILGSTGAEGAGSTDSTILHLPHGADYLGFVKRVHGAGDPSVNHLIIVEDRAGLYQDVLYYTGNDYHALRGLGGAPTRIYYLLYAGNGGSYINDSATTGIMAAFLDLLTPPWLSASPVYGSVAPGSSAAVTVTLDAGALPPGTQHGTIVVSTNDPDEPSATVPVTLHVGATMTAPVQSPSGRKP